MKQIRKYCIGFSAVFLSEFIVKGRAYGVLIAVISFFSFMIILSFEITRFIDFLRIYHIDAYSEYRNFKGNARVWMYRFICKYSRKTENTDLELLDNCRRMLICQYCIFPMSFLLMLFGVVF